MADLKDQILELLEEQHGILFAQPAIVHRPTYLGRGILAPNTAYTPEMTDKRGYVPVEWWVMSKTQALNDVIVDGEGLTKLFLKNDQVSFVEALKVAEKQLLGEFSAQWPLTKVLDIGGRAMKPDFETGEDVPEEVPPIPCHVHAGEVVNGKCQGCGKLEAYFFPPLHVPPYNVDLSGQVVSRLGLKPDTSQEEFIASLKKFGVTDRMYHHLSVYEVKPWESWTIQPKVVHAPGPWLTFEIQLPQDDYNLLAWQLGQPVSEGDKRAAIKSQHQLKGIANEQQLFEQTVDWDMNVDVEFKSKWHRKAEPIESGSWGRQIRIFFHDFYGEGFEISPGEKFERKPDEKPYAAIVWSGSGTANGLPIDACVNKHKEFLVTPGHSLKLHNTGQQDLLVYAVFPIDQKAFVQESK
eukprot:m.151654 g.151654  ORF g.151654 m.151654 type:complete len:409 (+) comp24514_c0_seq3:1-1227(+)